MSDVLKEIQSLRKELERHNLLYYVNDAPEISDFEYDAMLRCYLNQSKDPPLLIAVKKNKRKQK